MPDFFRVRLAIVARSAGHSAAKRSAYQACGLAIDHLGRRYDFSRKASERAIPTLMLLPDGAPSWSDDPASLWNRAASAEKRVDAQEARIIDWSMPRAVPRELWAAAVRHVCEPFRARGMALQIDVHDTPASDGGRNVNVHGLATLRRMDGNGFARKKERAWNDLFREGDGRTIRNLVAERLTAFCQENGIDYQGDARSNAARDLPAPEPELPGWNARATKRTGTPTAAVVDLHRHRLRRRRWEDARAELSKFEAERAALERAAREVLARRIEPTSSAVAKRAREDWRAAALRAWQGGKWIEVNGLRNIAKVRVDEERRCLWIDLVDGSTLVDSGDAVRLRGPVTWTAALETAAAAERHGWTEVQVHGDQAYRDAVTVACALRGIPVVNQVLSPEGAAVLKAKLAARAEETTPIASANKKQGRSQAAYLRLLERNRLDVQSVEAPDSEQPPLGPTYRPRLVGREGVLNRQ